MKFMYISVPFLLAAVLLSQEPERSVSNPQPTFASPNDVLERTLSGVVEKLDKQNERFDFMFAHKDWDFSMSAVLSTDQKSLWVMAWLDELPKEAARVPRNCLLRMLATNDAMGSGKFFAYIPNNRRFVLQRSVPFTAVDSAKLTELLQDLAETVTDTAPVWQVEKW